MNARRAGRLAAAGIDSSTARRVSRRAGAGTSGWRFSSRTASTGCRRGKRTAADDQPAGRAFAHLLRQPRGAGRPDRAHRSGEIPPRRRCAHRPNILGSVLPAESSADRPEARFDLGCNVFFPPFGREPTRSSGAPSTSCAGAREIWRIARQRDPACMTTTSPRCWLRVLRLCENRGQTTFSIFRKRDRAKRGLSPVFESERLVGKWTKLAQGHVMFGLGLLVRRGLRQSASC